MEHGTEKFPLIYTRDQADMILQSHDVMKIGLDPTLFPIAGLRTISLKGSQTDIPLELLSRKYQPIVISDLDEMVWKHIEAVVQAMGNKTGKPITMEYFRHYGNTRRIPEWNTPEGMNAQDEIIGGSDDRYFPYVNKAFPEAVASLISQQKMGHGLAYLTGRPAFVIPATLRVLEWNGLPVDTRQKTYVDAFTHIKPKDGFVYGADAMPMLVGRTYEHKQEVVKHWLHHLRQDGWEGTMVVLDDLPKSYGSLLKSGEITVISLTGDVNASREPLAGETRVGTWEAISDILMGIHRKAVASDSSPYRLFECGNRVLKVEKDSVGPGYFKLNDIPRHAYTWIESGHDSVQQAFENIGY